MSGHSKWATIKRKKGAKDQARGKLFSKLSKDITVASQQGGSDIAMNFALRLAVDKAKGANMPSDNIDRAIKKGSGALQGEKMTQVSYEVNGPGGSLLIVDCNTDNTNRSLTEVRTATHMAGGTLASEGSISWQFDTLGLIALEAKKEKPNAKFGKEVEYENIDPEELQLQLFDYDGVEDVNIEGEQINLFVEREKLYEVRDKLMGAKIKVNDANLIKLANNEIELTGEVLEKYTKLIDALEELDDVDQVWSNVL